MSTPDQTPPPSPTPDSKPDTNTVATPEQIAAADALPPAPPQPDASSAPPAAPVTDPAPVTAPPQVDPATLAEPTDTVMKPSGPPAGWLEGEEEKRKAASLTSSPGGDKPAEVPLREVDSRTVTAPPAKHTHEAEIIRGEGDKLILVKTPGDGGQHSSRHTLATTVETDMEEVLDDVKDEVKHLLDIAHSEEQLLFGKDGKVWKFLVAV